MSRFLTKILNEPPGGRQESENVDAHKAESQTPTSENVDAHILSESGAHSEEIQTPTSTELRRPQSSKRDAHARSVDANASTKLAGVDAKTPTSRKSGRTTKKGAGAHKSDRHPKNLVRQHFRIPPELDEKFRMFRARRKLDLQEFYQLAGAHFIESVDAHEAEGVDALASHDDRDKMILFKTHPPIINLYLRYNPENRWKPADDFEGQRYNDKDIRLIEMGIITTQFNARFKRIHSFKYFCTEIDIALETPLDEETIEIMLKHSRRRWEQARSETTKPA